MGKLTPEADAPFLPFAEDREEALAEAAEDPCFEVEVDEL